MGPRSRVGFVRLVAGAVVVSAVALACGGRDEPHFAPALTRAPTDQTIALCGYVTLVAAATGTEPLRYQWFKDGVAVDGESRPLLSIAAVSAAVGGSYSIRVSNDWGSATSAPAVLTVDAPLGTAPIALSAVGGRDIVVNHDRVFWTAADGVLAASKECGTPRLVLYRRQSWSERPRAIGLVGDQVVWTDGNLGFVARVDAAGGQGALLAQQARQVYSLAISGDQVYWSDPFGAAIEWTAVAGGPVTTWSVGTYPANAPNGITTDDAYVYWCDMGANTIDRMPLGGGEVTVLANADPSGYLTGIATDGTDVFWGETLNMDTDSPTGMVRKVARGGGAPTTLATTATVALDVRVSGGQLYWTSALLVPSTTPTGAVSRVPVDGSAVAETLVSQLDSPWDLALDEAYVYWVELPLHAPGRVMKMRR